jgi:hypothetical protein
MKLPLLRPQRRQPLETAELEPANRPWSATLALVCQECEGVTASLTPAQALKEAKAVARASGPKKRIRVTGSGCLDVCPSVGVAIAVCADGIDAHCFVARSASSIEQLSSHIA